MSSNDYRDNRDNSGQRTPRPPRRENSRNSGNSASADRGRDRARELLRDQREGHNLDLAGKRGGDIGRVWNAWNVIDAVNDELGPDARRGFLMPQVVDIEAAFLGCFLIDPEQLAALTWVRSEMFYREAHGLIWQAMLDAFRAWRERGFLPLGTDGEQAQDRLPTDLLSVIERLDRQGQLEQVGGPAYVSSLANITPTAYMAGAYARQIERVYIQREIISAGIQVANAAYHWMGDDPNELQRQSLQTLTAAAVAQTGSGTRWYRDVIREAIEQTQARMERRPDAEVLWTGIKAVDEQFVGSVFGDMLVIAARASVGKSAYAMGVFWNMLEQLRANGSDATGLYVTLEMSGTAQAIRHLATHSDVDQRQIHRGFHASATIQRDENGDIIDDVDGEALTQFYHDAAELEERYGYLAQVIDEPKTIDEIEEELARAVAEQNCRILLVDQLDLIDTETGGRRESERERIEAISRRLKILAERYHVLVIVLAQLNREAAKVRPDLAHLRSSGRVEQDADQVIMLYRPAKDYPHMMEDEYWPRYMEVWLNKQRGGDAPVMAPVWWVGAKTDIRDWPAAWPLPELNEEGTGLAI